MDIYYLSCQRVILTTGGWWVFHLILGCLCICQLTVDHLCLCLMPEDALTAVTPVAGVAANTAKSAVLASQAAAVVAVGRQADLQSTWGEAPAGAAVLPNAIIIKLTGQ